MARNKIKNIAEIIENETHKIMGIRFARQTMMMLMQRDDTELNRKLSSNLKSTQR